MKNFWATPPLSFISTSLKLGLLRRPGLRGVTDKSSGKIQTGSLKRYFVETGLNKSFSARPLEPVGHELGVGFDPGSFAVSDQHQSVERADGLCSLPNILSHLEATNQDSGGFLLLADVNELWDSVYRVGHGETKEMSVFLFVCLSHNCLICHNCFIS